MSVGILIAFLLHHELKTSLFLEKHNEIRSAEEEITQHVALLMRGSHKDVGFEIDRRHLGHPHGYERHQSICSGIHDYVTKGLSELPSCRIDWIVFLLFLIPRHL